MSLLKSSHLTLKLFIGTFFMFSIYCTVKLSQISLDPYTLPHIRSIIINVPTALADITLCLFLNKIMKRTCRYMFILNCLFMIGMIVLENMEDKSTIAV